MDKSGRTDKNGFTEHPTFQASNHLYFKYSEIK